MDYKLEIGFLPDKVLTYRLEVDPMLSALL